MAADISEITESNQEYPTVAAFGEPTLADIEAELRILHGEIHEAVRLLRKHDQLLEQFRPLLDRYATPAGAYMAARQARRQRGNGD